MAEFNPMKATTTSMEGSVQNYIVSPESLDFVGDQDENYWYFTEATQNFGHYKKIPELKRSVDALALWTTGKGWTTLDTSFKVDLDKISGWGEDTFSSICRNLIVVKKVVGDAFAEIIRADDGTLINLKPISPERMRLVLNRKGIIQRYDYYTSTGWKPLALNKVLHLCNDRVGDEIHGTSVVDACKWVIEARNEAMETYRKILKRSLALGVLYVDSDDETKIKAIMAKYKDSVDKGEVLVLPAKVAEIKDGKVSVHDFLSWIGYLENFFYQAVGIPKVILGGVEAVSTGDQKVGYLTFEQVYMAEQRELEGDLWKQLAIPVKFERPVSLKDDIQQTETKNSSQEGFQPKDTGVSMNQE